MRKVVIVVAVVVLVVIVLGNNNNNMVVVETMVVATTKLINWVQTRPKCGVVITGINVLPVTLCITFAC